MITENRITAAAEARFPSLKAKTAEELKNAYDGNLDEAFSDYFDDYKGPHGISPRWMSGFSSWEEAASDFNLLARDYALEARSAYENRLLRKLEAQRKRDEEEAFRDLVASTRRAFEPFTQSLPL